jgi:hypothetical protein
MNGRVKCGIGELRASEGRYLLRMLRVFAFVRFVVKNEGAGS